MRYSIIVALDNNFALTNNFVENLLLTESLQNDSELVIVSIILGALSGYMFYYDDLSHTLWGIFLFPALFCVSRPVCPASKPCRSRSGSMSMRTRW